MNEQKLISDQAIQIKALEGLLEVALSRIEDLEAQIKTNSSNSSRPPSSDGQKKRPAFPRKKGGRRGGKTGHGGKTLKMVEQVDYIRIHKPVNDCDCGCNLSSVPMAMLSEKRQVFDLPPKLIEVTEHRLGSKRCPDCGKTKKGSYPVGVKAPVQYGRRVRALISMLNIEQSLPVGRVCELFNSLTGYQLNENTVVTAIERMYKELEEEEELIKAQILASDVAHADETGGRIAGKLHWIHNLSTRLYTYFFVHQKRGTEALTSQESITDEFDGYLIHDFWKSYFKLENAKHGLCGAHLLRELNWLKEYQQSKWADKMHALLMYMYEFSDGGKGKLSKQKHQIALRQYDRVLTQADLEEPPPEKKSRGRPKKSKGRNLMERLRDYKDDVLHFAELEQIPFTNNLAERDVRPWKTKLKVSGCFRTFEGAKRYARIKGFCSTARKNQKAVYQELVNAMSGQSFLTKAFFDTT